MFNIFKRKAEQDDQPKKPKVTFKMVQAEPRPGQSMDDFIAEMKEQHGIEGDVKQGSPADIFKLLGKDAFKVLKSNGVDVDELVASGAINTEDIPQ